MRYLSLRYYILKKIQTNLITKQPFILYLLIIQTKVIVKYDDKGFIAPTFITKQSLKTIRRCGLAEEGGSL